MHTKFIFITGGVLSSLGKGLAAASIGSLLEARGLSVSNQKLDPYINVDPGTMNPFQHGEVYVTDDGAETDLDLGHYERFTSTRMGKANISRRASLYSVISRKKGRFLCLHRPGNPHITNEIKEDISRGRSTTIFNSEDRRDSGDIESLPSSKRSGSSATQWDVKTPFPSPDWVPFIRRPAS